MEERNRSNHHVAELPCKVCHLQPVLLLATRLLADRDAKPLQYEKELRKTDSRPKWAFEKETQPMFELILDFIEWLTDH